MSQDRWQIVGFGVAALISWIVALGGSHFDLTMLLVAGGLTFMFGLCVGMESVHSGFVK